MAMGRKAWKRIVEQAKTHEELYRQEKQIKMIHENCRIRESRNQLRDGALPHDADDKEVRTNEHKTNIMNAAGVKTNTTCEITEELS